MKLIDVKVLRGPNFWSVKRKKLVQFTLDLEDLEQKPTDLIPQFYERLQQLLPSLYEHECSEGHKGGFFERVKRGTWMGHVIEHIALELQSLAGITVGFGRTRGTGKEGVYHMVYEYGEESEGIYAGKAAIRVVEAIISGNAYDVEGEVSMIRDLWFREKPGPSSASLIEEAEKRNIPVLRLDNDSLFQLGYGKKQKRIEATISCQTSNLAVDIAGDKSRTKQLLTEANIPVPYGEVISKVNNLRETVDLVGFPLVIKPLDGNHGKGATINVKCWEEALCAFDRAKKVSENVIVEKYITGRDFRILIVNNKLVAAALRIPACVIGDGRHTVRELV
ncbi:MAG TPA: cyanophycin synthetase, partial [Flavisolibacter sp.]|nr:cyanophycin synthetase [Flavisolibacter sp.]